MNKSKSKLSFILLNLFLLITFIQCTRGVEENSKTEIIQTAPVEFSEAWNKLEDLEKNGRYDSAYNLSDSILNVARENGYFAEEFKALDHKIKNGVIYKEDFEAQIFTELSQFSKESEGLRKSIYNAITASYYSQYFNNNSWKIMSRSPGEYNKSNFETWSEKDFKEKINELLLTSMEEEEILKNTFSENALPILETDTNTLHLRPTLYDVLLQNALNFYSNEDSWSKKIADQTLLNDSLIFADYKTFSQLKIDTSTSNTHRAFSIYRDLISFHTADENKNALAYINAQRLQFAKEKNTNPLADKWYVNALKMVIENFQETEESTIYNFFLASEYALQAAQYNPEGSGEYRWKYQQAIEICEEALRKFPNSYGSQQCKTLLSSIKNPKLSVQLAQVSPANTVSKAFLTYRNLEKINFKIYKISQAAYNSIKKNYRNTDKEAFSNFETIKIWDLNVDDEGDFQSHSLEIKLDSLALGFYALSAESIAENDSNVFMHTGFQISNLAATYRIVNERLEYLITDRNSGLPVENALIQLESINSNNNKTYTAKTNKDGVAKLNFDSDYGNFSVEISKGHDNLQLNNNRFYINNNEFKAYEKIHIFTDRAIYRPGQEVFYKIIAVNHQEKSEAVIANKNLNVKLYDVNRKEIANIDLKTNTFGSASGSFTLPTSGRAGRMTIEAENSRLSFSVEEYKRPSFEVKMEVPKEAYKLGDSIKINATATAFSGASIDNATVNYRVIRQTFFPYWRSYFRPVYNSDHKEILSSSTKTKNDGSFQINFKAIADDVAKNETFSRYFTYRITADVIDISGETRSGELSLSMGEKSIILNADIGESVFKEDLDNIPVSANNLNGKSNRLKIKAELYKIDLGETPKREPIFGKPDQFSFSEEEYQNLFPYDYYRGNPDYAKMPRELVESVEITADSISKISFSHLEETDPGMYLLKLIPLEKAEETEEFEKIFTLYSKNSKSPATNRAFEAKDVILSVSPGEKASILISSTLESQPVRIDVERTGIITETKWINLNKEQQILEFNVTNFDINDFVIHVFAGGLNRTYSNSFTVNVLREDRKIDISLETFRDKMKPGSEEEWILSIDDDDIEAEVLASMYDASLDVFAKKDWILNNYRNNYYSKFHWRDNYPQITYGNYYHYTYSISSPGKRNLPHLKYLASYYTHYNTPLIQRDAAMEISSGVSNREGDAEMQEYAMVKEEVSDTPKMQEEESTNGDFPVRSDFRETAFFYPHLKADKAGKVKISFTVPDALTRWNFRALAHSKDLKTGNLIKEIVSSKELMITANSPRFFRESDEMFYPVKIKNLSKQELSGTAEINFIDPFTNENLNGKFQIENQKRDFSADNGESVSAEWKIQIPEGVSAVIVRVTAKSGNFSDGEEILIPVLTNRILVTETLPFTIHGPGESVFTLDKLKNNTSNTLKSERLVLEFSNNPAWYAVQSMPYLMEKPNANSEQIFARIFANSLSTKILQSKPKLKQSIEAWKAYDADAFLSNLEKNEELKNILLEETPWLLEAEDEAASKRRIALLLDINRMQNEQNSAIEKLIETQHSDGAFPWYSGMNSNRFITQYILSGFGHLLELDAISTQDNPALQRMLEKAIAWMDQEMTREYIQNKKNNSGINIRNIDLQYLYARSYFQHIPFEGVETKAAFEAYINAAEKNSLEHNLQGQARLALALHKFEKEESAQLIITSLRERALERENYGMYWKELNNSFHWFESPIETQAILIEAFEAIDKNLAETDAMRTWLINQKRTQNWGNTKATSLAIYALLLRGSDWLDETPTPKIRIGNQKLIFEGQANKNEVLVNSSPGTGYFKTTFSKSEITSEMATVRINSDSDKLAWGGIYWQYFEDLDKITPSESPLQIEKELFKEFLTEDGVTLKKIEGSSPLQVGDKVIVRIIIKTEQAMEFIHLKDMRSAGFEPLNVISGYKYNNGIGYYESTSDVSTNFFFDRINRGTYVFEYPLRVSQKGKFSNGISSIQCLYAPEFSSHSAGINVTVK